MLCLHKAAEKNSQDSYVSSVTTASQSPSEHKARPVVEINGSAAVGDDSLAIFDSPFSLLTICYPTSETWCKQSFTQKAMPILGQAFPDIPRITTVAHEWLLQRAPKAKTKAVRGIACEVTISHISTRCRRGSPVMQNNGMRFCVMVPTAGGYHLFFPTSLLGFHCQGRLPFRRRLSFILAT